MINTSMAFKENKPGMMKRLQNQAFKIIPHVIDAGGGKFEIGLVKFPETPPLKASINAKFETPIPRMLFSAFMSQYRRMKTRNAMALRNKGNIAEVKDDWIVVDDSQLDLEKEVAVFARMSQEFEKLVEEEENVSGYVDRPQLIESYMHMVDDEEESAGDSVERDEVELLISNLDLQGGISTSTCAEKDYLVVPVHAENKDDVGVQTVKEEELGAGKPEESHAAAELELG